jgi:hypothetical protein
MNSIKISKVIRGDFYSRELWQRESEGMSVYTKIDNAIPSKTDGSVTIEVNANELFELHQEADFWCGPLSDYSMSRSLYTAFRSLAGQTGKLFKVGAF